MLSRSSIFLKLIGSFYEQIGSTDFMRSFDTAYSTVLYSRYSDIIVRAIASNKKSSIFNSVHFGFINPMEVDVVNRIVKIRDVNNNIVDYADFVSFSSIYAEHIHRINNSSSGLEIDSSALIELSESTTTGPIPVIYGNIGSPKDVIAEWIDIHNGISPQLIKELSAVTLESISKILLYKDDSRKKIETISNVLFGAVFAGDWETVIRVDEDKVYTSKNEYDIDGVNEGKIIVSVGDELEPMQLITMVARLSTNLSDVLDLQKISSYMISHGMSFSNYYYLSTLSKEVAKRKIVVNVEPSVIASVDTDTLGTVATLIKSFNISAQTNSEILSEDSIDANDSYANVYSWDSNIDVGVDGRWILEIISPEESIVASVEEGYVQENYEELPILGYVNENIDGGVLSESVVVSPNEDTIGLIVESSKADVVENDSRFGYLIDTNIGEIDDNASSALISDSSELLIRNIDSSLNDVSIIKEGIVTIGTEFSAVDSSEYMITSGDVSYMAFGDALSLFTEMFDYFSPADSLFPSTEVSIEEMPYMSDSILNVVPSSIETDLTDSLLMERIESDDIFTSEDIAGQVDINYEMTIEIEEVDVAVNELKDSLIMHDYSNIESDIVIDD